MATWTKLLTPHPTPGVKKVKDRLRCSKHVLLFLETLALIIIYKNVILVTLFLFVQKYTLFTITLKIQEPPSKLIITQMKSDWIRDPGILDMPLNSSKIPHK